MLTNEDERKAAEEKTKKELAKSSQHSRLKNAIGFLCHSRQRLAVPAFTPTVLFSQKTKRVSIGESVREFNERQAYLPTPNFIRSASLFR